MTGGLIQLVTTGIQDVPISSNPDITFFKAVYKKHTQFSINQQLKYLGAKKFNTENRVELDYNGDLLYGQFFKLEIPYFDILRNTVTTKVLPNIISKLELNYNNELCIMINYNNNWYLIPEYLFKLSNITTIISSLDVTNITDDINNANLNSYLNVNNISTNISYYTIKDNSFSPIVNILKIKATFWEQYWLDLLSTTNNIILSNTITTLITYLTNINNNLIDKMYTNYYKKFNNKYTSYFNFNIGINETHQYFNYINTPAKDLSTLKKYNNDIDVVYNYCISNNLNFDLFKNNVLLYNSLVLQYILNNFYNNNLLYTFTKANFTNTNYIYNDITEWKRLFNINNTLSDINNQIYLTYIDNYYSLEKNINTLFSNFTLANTDDIYTILWLFNWKFTNITKTTKINFNTFYSTTNIKENVGYNQYNYLYNIIQYNQTSDIIIYNTNNTVDLLNIYGYISYKIINYIIVANNPPTILNPIILWSNNVLLRLFNRYSQYKKNLLWNGNIINTSSSFSYYMYPGNTFTYNNFKDSFYELLYKTSFIGNLSITNGSIINLLQNMLILNTQANITNINNYQSFYDLKITNTYNYTYDSTGIPKKNIYIINPITNTIIIIYDNNYDEQNMNIKLSISNTDITQHIINIKKDFIQINTLYTGILLIDIDTSINLSNLSQNNTNIILNVEYKTSMPLIIFPNQNILYPNNQVLRYNIINKNDDNTYNLNRINNNNTIDFDSYQKDFNILPLNLLSCLTILNIEYYDKSKIIRPNISSVQGPIFTTIKSINVNNITITSQSLNFPISIQSNTTKTNYLYKISYTSYDNKESTPIPISNTNNLYTIGGVITNLISNIPISSNYNINGINIYRTTTNLSTYYKLPSYNSTYLSDLQNNNTTTSFIDNIPDTELITFPQLINNNIYFTSINTDSTNLYYLYKISYIVNNIESNASNIIDAVYVSSTNYKVTLNNLPNTIVNIYRTIGVANPNIINPKYYYVGTTNATTYEDKTLDSILINNLIKFPIYSTYTILAPTNQDANNYSYPSGTNPGLNGTYYYMISYISNTNESECSNMIGPITVSNQAINISNLPISLDASVTGRKIYRTNNYLKPNINNYYLVTTINDNTTTNYIDTTLDSMLNINIIPIVNNKCIKSFVTIQYNQNQLTLTNLDNTPINFILDYNNIYNMYIDIIPQNNYQIYNNQAYIKNNSYYLLNTSISPNNFYYLVNPTNFTNYIKLIIDNNINLNGVNTSALVPADTIDNKINYNIISISQNNFVPNLEQYISLSTDYRYFNNKQVTDFDNYLFNKPFMMLMNTSNTNTFSSYSSLINNLSSSYINFYNIPFRLNNTSTISINNNNVLYLLPIASSQYFIYNNSPYYTLDKSNNQIQLKSTPSDFSNMLSTDIDEFFYNNIDLNTNIRGAMIDYYYNQYNNIVNINQDIINIINLIQGIDTNMDNLYNKIINSNTLYGTTTQTIINNFKYVNSFNNLYLSYTNNLKPVLKTTLQLNNSSIDQPLSFFYTSYNFIYNYNIQIKKLDIKRYIKKDFLTFSQYISDAMYLTLVPIYNIFSSKYILSNDLSNYLTDIHTFFNQHIQYITNNQDYLAIYNSSNIIDKYTNDSQNIQYTDSIKYDLTNVTLQTINLLHPILSTDNFSQMLVNNNLIPINITNNTLQTTNTINVLNPITETDNNDSQLILDKTNTFDSNIFNFIGIINVNNNNITNNGTIAPTNMINIGLNLPFDYSIINNNTTNYTYPSLTTTNPINYISLNNLLVEYNPEYYIRLLYLYDYSPYNHYILKIKDLANLNFINTYYYAWIYPNDNISSIYKTRIINNINDTFYSFTFNTTTNLLIITLNFDYNITNNTIIRIANNKQCSIYQDVMCTLITNLQFQVTITNTGLKNLSSYYIYGYMINDINNIMDSVSIIVDSNGIVNFVNSNLEQTLDSQTDIITTNLVIPNIPTNSYYMLDNVIYYYTHGSQINMSAVYNNTNSFYLSPGKVNSIKLINDNIIKNNCEIFIKNQNNDIWTNDNNNIPYSILNYPYKYYTNNYSLDSFVTGILDPSTILEYNYSFPKPTVIFGGNYIASNNSITSSSLPSNSIYYIVITNNTTNLVFKSNFTNNLYKFNNITNYTIYYSLQYPTIVSVGTFNLSLIQIDEQNYTINFNNKIFLEINEIIAIQDTIFKVLGNNILTGNYELLLINASNVDLNKNINIPGNYNFYWTFGVYSAMHNTVLPDIPMNNILQFYTSKILLPGTTYYNGNNICFSTTNDTSPNYVTGPVFPFYKNIFCFMEDTLNVKLFYVTVNNKTHYYVLDSFIRIKLYDKIYYNNTIYEVTYIKNRKIYLYPDVNIFPVNKKYIDVQLPYQPFEIKDIMINSDYTITPNIDRHSIIINNPNNNNQLLMISIQDNIIPIQYQQYLDTTNYTVRIMKTDYNGYFSNLYKVSSDYSVSKNLSDFNITLNCQYSSNNTILLLNQLDIMDNYSFYYMQPVLYNGIFNYITNISLPENTTRYILTLLYPDNLSTQYISSKNITISLTSKIYNQYNYFSLYKFKYNYGIQYYDTFAPGDMVNILKYTLVNDNVVNIEDISNIIINTSFTYNNVSYDYLISSSIANGAFIVQNDGPTNPVTISNVMAYTTFVPNPATSISLFNTNNPNQLIPNMILNGQSILLTNINYTSSTNNEPPTQINPLAIPTTTIYNLSSSYIYYYGIMININNIPSIVNSNTGNDNYLNKLDQIIYQPPHYSNNPLIPFINYIDNNGNLISTIENIFNIPFIVEPNDTPYYLSFNDIILPPNTNVINDSMMVVYNGQYINVLNLPVDYYDTNGKIINMTNVIKYKYYYNNYEFDYYRRLVIKNTNIVYGSYHLLLEVTADNTNYVHLVKITYPNNLLFCTDTIYNYSSTFYLDKLILIHINRNNEFTFGCNNIQVTNKQFTENKNNVELISSYTISKYNVPGYDNITNNYTQDIIIVDPNNPKLVISLDLSTYRNIYINPTDTVSYNISLKPTSAPDYPIYVITSNIYFENLNTIYTKKNNYIKSIVQSANWKKEYVNHNDISLDNQTTYNEYNIFNIQLYNTNDNINNNNIQLFNNYIYQYYDYSDIINNYIYLQPNYYIHNLNTFIIKNINTNSNIYNQIEISYTINDNKLVYNGYNTIPIFITKVINKSVIFDVTKFYSTVEKLNNKLQSKLNININDIVNYVKPFISNWSLISSYLLFTSANQAAIGSRCFLQYNSTNNSITQQQNSLPVIDTYNIMTNNEIRDLTSFLSNIQSDVNYSNYKILQQIEQDIYKDKIINRWINNIDFFKNVQYYINSYLIIKNYNYAKYTTTDGITYKYTTTDGITYNNPQKNNIVFNGTEILFNNMSVPYLSNEFTYNRTNNIVYRGTTSFTNLQNQINNILNNITNISNNDIYFGVNINNLLGYLNKLGNDYNKYINNTTLDVYNYEPVKYMMNVIDSQYKLNKSTILNTILDSSKIFDNINTLSYVTFAQNQQIQYNGLYSLNNYNITNNQLTNIHIYNTNPINIITKTLQNINILYDFKIVYNSNIIRSDCSYSLSYYNGNLIGNIVPTTTTILYSNQLEFKSYYNLKSNDLIKVSQTKQYNITPRLLGQLYQVTFPEKINISKISNIYYSGTELIIERINSNICNVIIPSSIKLSAKNNIFELRYNVIIKSIVNIPSTDTDSSNIKYNLNFYDNFETFLINFINPSPTTFDFNSILIASTPANISTIFIIINNTTIPLLYQVNEYGSVEYSISINPTLKSFISQNKNYTVGIFINLNADSSSNTPIAIIPYNKKYTNIYECVLSEDFINQSYTKHDNIPIILNRFKLNNIIPDDIYLYNSNILWLYFNKLQNIKTIQINSSPTPIQIIISNPIFDPVSLIPPTLTTTPSNSILEINQQNIISTNILSYTQDLGSQELQKINTINAASTNTSMVINNTTISPTITSGSFYISNYLCYIDNINYFPFIYDKNNNFILDSNNNKILDTNNLTLFIYNTANIPILTSNTTIDQIETNLSINNLYIDYSLNKPQIYGDINLSNTCTLNGILRYITNIEPTQSSINNLTTSPTTPPTTPYYSQTTSTYYGLTLIIYGKLNPNIINNNNLSNITINITNIKSIYYDSINNKLTIYTITKITPIPATIKINGIDYTIINSYQYTKYKYTTNISNANAIILSDSSNNEQMVTLINTNTFYLDTNITNLSKLYQYNNTSSISIDYLNCYNSNNTLIINNFNIIPFNNKWLVTITQNVSTFSIDNNSAYSVSYSDILIDKTDDKKINQNFIISLVKNSDGTMSFISSIYINQLCPITINRYSYDITKIYNNPYIIKYNGYLNDKSYKVVSLGSNTYSISPIPPNLNIINNTMGSYIKQLQIYFITDSNNITQQVNFNENKAAANSIIFTTTYPITTSIKTLTSYCIENIMERFITSFSIPTPNYISNNNIYTYSISPIPSILQQPLNILQQQMYYITNMTDSVSIFNDQITFTNIIGNIIYFTSPIYISPTNTLKLNVYSSQFYKILQPEEYIKLQINYTNTQEYAPNNNLYIVPFNNVDSTICSQYMYKINIKQGPLTQFLALLIPELLNNNLQNIIQYILFPSLNIKCSIISVDTNNNIIFSSPQELDQSSNYNIIIYVFNNTTPAANYIPFYYNNIMVTFYQTSVNKFNVSKQNSLNNIYIYTSDNTSIYYNSSSVYSNYQLYIINNPAYKIIKTNNKTNNSLKNTQQIITNTYETAILVNPNKIFEYMRLYIDDQLIEELNEYTFNADYNLYSSAEKRKQLDNIIKFKKSGNIDELITNTTTIISTIPTKLPLPIVTQAPLSTISTTITDTTMIININPYLNTPQTISQIALPSTNKIIQINKITPRSRPESWEINIPLNFWFNYDAGQSIPLVALPNSKISIRYKLRDITNIINNDTTSNNYTFSTTPTIKVSLISDTILLENEERALFGTYSHEYMINIYKTYTPKIVSEINSIIPYNLSGLIKDIILISNPINTNGNAYQEIVNNYDARYQRYVDASKYYIQFIKNGYYSDTNQYNFISDFNTLENIDYEILNNPGARYNNFIIKFSTYEARFLMYFIDTYCPDNPSIIGLDGNPKNIQNETLFYYLKYMYNNSQSINEISPIDSMTFYVNGVELFASRESDYFTSVVPYTKFKSSLPVGNYAYTFSLYPLEKQPSGHLNFTHYDSIMFKIRSNNNVMTQPYTITPIVKEYNILRIISGIGSLAWI